MEIAYLILAHKYPGQLQRLINKLNSDNTSFILHIDKKTDIKVYEKMVDILSNQSNIYFCKRQKVTWGNFSQVIATINGIQEIFNSQIECDYIKLLTGQDYPVKSNQYIRNFLEKNSQKEFIEFFELPYQRWHEGGEVNGGIDRVNYYYFNLFNKRLKLPLKRPLPNKFKPFAGSAYWCLSRKCIEYINKFISEHDSFINFFKNVNLPDEVFFQTILLNSPFQDSIINTDLTYTNWHWNSAHPVILETRHFHDLSESSYLFARKFDAQINSEILDLIDQSFMEERR